MKQRHLSSFITSLHLLTMLWPFVEFNPGSPWFNFPAALVNSQLVCLRPVGILNSCCCFVPSFRCVSLALKGPCGERSIKHVLCCIMNSFYYNYLISLRFFSKNENCCVGNYFQCWSVKIVFSLARSCCSPRQFSKCQSLVNFTGLRLPFSSVSLKNKRQQKKRRVSASN